MSIKFNFTNPTLEENNLENLVSDETIYFYEETLDFRFDEFDLDVSQLSNIILLEELNNIAISDYADNDFLVYDNTQESWVNKTPSETLLSLGTTATALELNYNDISLLGTAEASKVLTFDANGDSIIPDSLTLNWGSGLDLSIFHDGTNSIISNSTGELRISAEVGSTNDIVIGNSTSHVQFGQDLTASGVIIGHKDNATALRVKGASHANDVGFANGDGDVQSYSGIFTNDAYNQSSHGGTKNTRFITGGNYGMDVVTQSAHGLHLVAGDGTQTDGEILMASKNSIKINTRVNPYAVTAPRYLQIDRVDKNTLDSNNTSNVELSVNVGNLVISSNTDISSLALTSQSVDLNLNSNKITNLASPSANSDAANKAYVDEVAQGIIAKPSVLAGSTQNLAGTYDNGTAGVGATLNLGPSGTLDIDGVTTWAQYDGILLKDQTTAAENGRYFVSQVGNATTDWILTRCIYCDTADEIPGAYVFVASGTTNEGSGWVFVVDDPSTFVVGTDDIDVYQFSSAGTVDAGAGLTKNGNIIDANVDGSSIEIDSNDNIKVKNGGVTSAMLAGSIANSKLNQLTVANKVALSSIDIDGAVDLGSISDTDLFIVDNNGAGNNYSATASNIAAYSFGKISGDATVTSTGTLSLTSNAITGQTVAQDAIADDDLVLIYDTSATALRKMAKSDFVSGLSSDLLDDTTPQLGGNLDVNSNEIVSASNGNITLRPNGTGFVKLGGNTNPAEIRLYCEVGDLHYVGFKSPAHSQMSASQVWTLPVADGNANQFLKTDGSGTLSWADALSTVALSDITAASTDVDLETTNGNFTLSSTGVFNLDSTATINRLDIKRNGTTLIGISSGLVNNSENTSIGFGELGLQNFSTDTTLTKAGYPSARLKLQTDASDTNRALLVGTINTDNSDTYGANNDSPLVLHSASNRIVFADASYHTSYPPVMPFFSIKKVRGTATDKNFDLDVELTVTRFASTITSATQTISKWNSNDYVHSVFLKVDGDGHITKLGQDTPANNEVLTWDGTNGRAVWSASQSSVSESNDLSDFSVNSPQTNEYLRYNGTNFVNTTISSSHVVGLGTSATRDVGTTANHVVALDTNAKLPAVDGSQLTNIHRTYSAQTSSFNASINHHYSVNTASGAVNVQLPQITSDADAGTMIVIKFKAGTNLLTILPATNDTVEGLASFVLTDSQAPGQSVTLVSDGTSDWEII